MTDEKPHPPEAIQWFDAFVASTEAAAEVMADKDKVEQMTAGKAQQASFDIEAYRNRKAIWKRVRGKLMGFHACLADIEFDGCEMKENGDIYPTGPVRFYKGLEPLAGLVFPSDEAVVICNFLTFYFDAYKKSIRPEVYIQSILMHQGITAENFDQYKDKLLIDNPWE